MNANVQSLKSAAEQLASKIPLAIADSPLDIQEVDNQGYPVPNPIIGGAIYPDPQGELQSYINVTGHKEMGTSQDVYEFIFLALMR